MEQVAFKGWIEEVFFLWESQYRNQLRDVILSPQGRKALRPQNDVIGDLRRIRNDLIHSGKASQQWTGKCEILKWFQPDECIILGMRHVIDLLNQLEGTSKNSPFSGVVDLESG